ncbi:hypothetical protein IEQ34_000117 [Dendrobium chrysotoxum]|uniref:Uncharacterized protein n=1 Tax=Dendrobium chrysotoxum TaxID=161865 RepID=A0AAV7HQ60_DENCH|nr:hypothetical protein IEQ34_000117 [Dendrobium chrysotoxum]
MDAPAMYFPRGTCLARWPAVYPATKTCKMDSRCIKRCGTVGLICGQGKKSVSWPANLLLQPNHEQVGKHDPSSILLRKDKLKYESNDGKLKEGPGDRIHHLPLQSQPLHKRKRHRHSHHRRRRSRLQHATQKLRPEGRIVYLHVAVVLLPRIQIGKESKKMSRGTYSGRWRRMFMEASEEASLSRGGCVKFFTPALTSPTSCIQTKSPYLASLYTSNFEKPPHSFPPYNLVPLI